MKELKQNLSSKINFKDLSKEDKIKFLKREKSIMITIKKIMIEIIDVINTIDKENKNKNQKWK